MTSFPKLSAECAAASDLDRAFLTLSNYYSQSKGKQAAAIRAKIDTVFPDHGKRKRPIALWHSGEDPDTPGMSALRREYYLSIVRPVLADTEFLNQLRKVTIRTQNMYYTTGQRDADVKVLEDGLTYWDVIYKQ